MQYIIIQLTATTRLKVYKEGGCQLEEYINTASPHYASYNGSWVIVDSNTDTLPAIKEAQHILANLAEKLSN